MNRNTFALSVLFLIACDAGAEDMTAGNRAQKAFAYVTREERREAGKEHPVTDWLSARGLAELEWGQEWVNLAGSDETGKAHDFVATLQLAVEASPVDWMTGELVCEYDSELDDLYMDEAILQMETGDWELEVGDLYVNYGEFFSHFANGPILEFAETRSDLAGILSWHPNRYIDASAFLYKGNSRPAEGASKETGWGLSLESSLSDSLTLGVSFIANLADGEDSPLEEEDLVFEKQVPGLNGYLVAGFGDFELTAEFVRALETFPGLESGFDRPFAWNLELAGFPVPGFSYAIRVEGSEEVMDQPRWQTGLSGTWQFRERIYLTVEYLYGEDRPEADESGEGSAGSRHLVGVLIILEL